MGVPLEIRQFYSNLMQNIENEFFIFYIFHTFGWMLARFLPIMLLNVCKRRFRNKGIVRMLVHYRMRFVRLNREFAYI